MGNLPFPPIHGIRPLSLHVSSTQSWAFPISFYLTAYLQTVLLSLSGCVMENMLIPFSVAILSPCLIHANRLSYCLEQDKCSVNKSCDIQQHAVQPPYVGIVSSFSPVIDI